jgi:hypothetical protein
VAKPLQQQTIDARNRKRIETAGRHAILHGGGGGNRQGRFEKKILTPSNVEVYEIKSKSE